MFKNAGIIAFTVGCHFLLAPSVFAERAPLTAAELIDASDLVVVGEITDFEIGTERSHIERGFGNYDYAIDVTLRISNIEKGAFEQSKTIIVRCFRIKLRKSIVEYFSSSGNHPIPGVGTSVRAHLYKDGGLWRVVFPNGLASFSEDVEVTDAEVVRQLKTGFTYLLPLELWIPILVMGVLLLIVVTTITRLRRRKLAAQSIADSDKNAS